MHAPGTQPHNTQPPDTHAAKFRRGEASRLARTVLQLRPGQAGQRLRLRAQRVALDRRLPAAGRWLLAGPHPAAAVGWPAGFAPLDAHAGYGQQAEQVCAALRDGELTLLGVTAAVAPAHADTTIGAGGTGDWGAADWALPGVPLLWRFHLYYWDWAWALAGAQDRGAARAAFAGIWQSWHAAVPPGRGRAWHPYPAALRAWTFCGLYQALVAGGAAEGAFLGELAAHVGFLRRNLETDVGGNHLIKNLKALTGLAVFFADDALLAATLGRLSRQLAVQVLPDGGHYERAPAYHCQVLGDLLDIEALLKAAGRAQPPRLRAAIAGMRRWLGVVLTPAGDLPLLNDGFPVSRDLLAQLAPVPAPRRPLQLLPDTGLILATVGGWQLLADVGAPCPRELPAHAHADTLSCVVHAAGAPLLVDTCTSTYAAGPVRDRERSTAAHNTVEVDGCDSTEVWGAFRAGRRARPRDATAWVEAETVLVEAEHDGYRGLPGRPVHRRRWELSPRQLRVDDTVSGSGRHRVVVRWHLAPGARLRLVPGGAEVITESGRFDITVTAESSGAGLGETGLTSGSAEIGTGFGRTVEAPVLTCALHSELPVRISSVWRQTQPVSEPRPTASSPHSKLSPDRSQRETDRPAG
jgi:uncharacterized heparinase superfamily protein